ncbi:MAG: hypothetical protein KKE73_08305 [Proteobacteria bacterium]|nr:hypothetical protein [Pseudomonadota bacterium]
MKTVPQREYVPVAQTEKAVYRVFADVPAHVTRDPDESWPREHSKELFAPILAQVARGDAQATLRTAERLCRHRPGNNLCLVEYARQMLAYELTDQALAVLENVLGRNSRNVEALKLFGFAQMQKGELATALDFLGQAVQAAPADSFAQINFQTIKQRIRPKGAGLKAPVMPAVAIATSLPPFDLETGQAAVASWRRYGFQVISVNTQAESALLEANYPEVEFVHCEHTAREECGKDYQYLDSLLDALAARGQEVCGIVNADIVLRGSEADWALIAEAARERFVFGSRVNIQAADATHGHLLEPGFDFFFFPKEFPTRVPRTGFVFGQPAWDVFFPAWATQLGFPRSFCYSPVALHVIHKMNWNRTSNSRFAAMALSWLAPEFADMALGYAGCAGYLRLLTGTIALCLNRPAKGGAMPLFCHGPAMARHFAPVDPGYWLHDSDETLVTF